MKKYDEFLQLVSIETDECVLWPSHCNRKGYGRVRHAGAMREVHVLACLAEYGEKPTPQHQVAHSCRNPSCLNRRHLRWATPTENSADQRQHGTQVKGALVGTSKLSAEQVDEIRQLTSVESSRAAARRFGVSDSHIRRIRRREYWV